MTTEKKKTKQISSEKKRTYTLSDGTVVNTNNNTGANVKRGKAGKHSVPAKKFSTETGKTNADWEVKDDLDSSEYPPPSTHPLYRKYWAESIDNVTSRTNFQMAHLDLLDALCRLKVELRALDDFIMANGHVFRVDTVLGPQRKTYPEVNEKHKILVHIKSYSQMLDLVPKKDKSLGIKKADKEDSWE